MTDHAPDKPALSPDGVRRREAMLGTLLGEVRRRREGRRARRRAAAATLMLATALGVALIVFPRARTTPEYVAGVETGAETPIAQPESPDSPMTTPTVTSTARFVVVRTDPDVLQRYAASGSPRFVQFLNDDDLLLALGEINRPTGLVRIGNRVMLTASVTDDPAGNDRLTPPRPPL